MKLGLTPSEIDGLCTLRRDLHQHPELGYQEQRTASVIADRMSAAGLDVTTGIAGTGVVAVLSGALDGPTIGWRADIDALPIVEENDVAYKSSNAGVMHACGHDVHTTVAVGVAELLAQNQDKIRGRRVFVFQPNEEGAPGAGPTGAEAMVEQGVIEDFGLEAMLAFHCMPSLEAGRVAHTGESVWAGSDRFVATVRGIQTHGAYPHLGTDPIVAAAQFVTALQTIPSRIIDAQDACVVSVCQFHAGNQFNVLPETASVEGIVRTLREDVRRRALDALDALAQGIGLATGTRIELEKHQGAMVTSNDPALLDKVVGTLREGLGEDGILRIPSQMGAEDFASFSQRIPTVYLMLGVRNEERGIVHPLHSPLFDVDESCIPAGVVAAAHLLTSLTL